MNATLDRFRAWFASRGWVPQAFQEEVWAAYGRGESGLVSVPTGAGKTYAATLAPLADIAERGGALLYIAPLRAMSRDVATAILTAVEALGLPLRVESRTGDTPSHARARQRRRPPEVLITTPESLCLMLCDADAAERFSTLRAVVVDEWHELLDSKRGSQVELCLARLRAFAPQLRVWAMSATLGNLDEAARAIVGTQTRPTLVRASLTRPVELTTLVPEPPEALPWSGHLGVQMLPRLLAWLDPAHSTLLFCNTRSQAERWYQEILRARPEWLDVIGLHHGSVDREVREEVEAGLKSGDVRIVVATASLDLGVDLAPVERVVQIGSPKGIARLLQRAGRSGHRPGETCRVLVVPTHAMQLIEVAACREALALGEIEPRRPLAKPLDVLAQHLVTCALGGGFTEEALRDEVRTAWSFRDLTDEEFNWALALVRDGGRTLHAYPEYRKVRSVDGVYRVPDLPVARLHRASVGTITGDATLTVRWFGGGTIGTIDEAFVTRLRPGERFVFAGHTLELVQIREMVALVRRATSRTTQTPHWPGTKLPITGSLGLAVRRVLDAVRAGRAEHPEVIAARFLTDEQARLGRVPGSEALLCETCVTADGHHLFVYPFEGRSVHDGLASLLALRMTRRQKGTLSIAVNDHGIELLSRSPFPFETLLADDALFDDGTLVEDIVASVNMSELARRRFRDIARVAGLVRTGLPAARASTRQLQASSGLLFDVFVRHDPDNLLVEQARREVLQQHFEQGRLVAVLRRLRALPREIVVTAHPTPMAWPLVAERIAVDTASSESLDERLSKARDGWTCS